MTLAALRETALRIATRACTEQGLPLQVADPTTLSKLATLLRTQQNGGRHVA